MIETNESTIRKIIGVGWNFPFKISSTGGIQIAGNTLRSNSVEKIRQSLLQILSTRINERVIRREFGSNLHDMLFEPNDSIFDSQIRSFVKNSILKYEHRVIVSNIEINRTTQIEAAVFINIDFIIIQTQQPGNLVFPLYKNLDIIS